MQKKLINANANRKRQAQAEKERKIIEAKTVSDLSSEDQQNVRTIKDEDLLDNPKNHLIYGEYEVEQLAETIRLYGFQGVIIAYPAKEDGKYVIESGHRRRLGGRMAGMTEFPVYIVDAPETEHEQIIRLNMANMHNRKMKPMIMARICKTQCEAHVEELKNLSEDKKEKFSKKDAIGLTCEDLEISEPLYYKYCALLKLIPELQTLVDEEQFSWAAISEASPLKEERQKELHEWLMDSVAMEKTENVTMSVIKDKIRNLKLLPDEVESSYDLNELGKKHRKVDGNKAVQKATATLMKAFEKESFYRADQRKVTIEKLREAQNKIEEKIAELENM